MRVLLTTDTVGGVWTFTRELSEGLLKRGHAVILLSLGEMPSDRQLAQYAELIERYAPNFHVRSSNIPLEWMQGNAHAFEYGAHFLRTFIALHKPDLLHFNQLAFGNLPVLDEMRPGFRIPRLATVHSDVLSWGAVLRPNGFEPALWLQRYLHFVPKGLAAHDALIAPTRWMADQVAVHYPSAPRPEVILNGRTLSRPGEPARLRKLQAVTAGRLWDEAKNTGILAKIVSPIPIHIAGNQMVQGREPDPEGLNHNLVMHGHMEEQELFTLFRESKLYLATSCYEPFGLAPLEAALCGCAIVANNIPSFREVWGEAALYFRGAQSLVNLLTRLAIDPDRLEAARERSVARARELTADRMTDAYVHVYERLLASTPPARLSDSERDFVHAV